MICMRMSHSGSTQVLKACCASTQRPLSLPPVQSASRPRLAGPGPSDADNRRLPKTEVRCCTLRHLAHQQVYGLNSIATFINHGHTRVSYDLLMASFADIAVITKHLQAGDGTITAWSVQAAFSTGVTRLVQRLALLRRAATGWCSATSSSGALRQGRQSANTFSSASTCGACRTSKKTKFVPAGLGW